MNTIIRKLNWYYYGIMALTVIVAAISYLLIVKQLVAPIDRLSLPGQVFQYVTILNVLVTVPLGLWKHKRNCKKIAKIEDEQERNAAYYKSALFRIIFVSNSMLFAFPAYYLMNDQSMLWLAAIGAIGWYFTKPTEAKMVIELNPTDEQY